MTVIFMAQRFRSKPSDVLRIEDGYVAYCFDEASCWIMAQLDEGKRPFFGRGDKNGAASGNADTIAMMKKLGAEVKGI